MDSTQGETTVRVVLHPMTFGWVLKRALFGTVVLAVLMGSFAWLTYSSLSAGGPETTGSISVPSAATR